MQIASLVLACCSCALACGLLVALFLCRNSNGKACSISQYAILACLVTVTILNIIFSAVSKGGSSSTTLSANSADQVVSSTAASAQLGTTINASGTVATGTVATGTVATASTSEPLDIVVAGGGQLPPGVPVDLEVMLPNNKKGVLPMLKYKGFRINGVNAHEPENKYGYGFGTFGTDDEADIGIQFSVPFKRDDSRNDVDYPMIPVKQIVWVGYTESSTKLDRIWRIQAINYDKAHSVSTIGMSPDADSTAYLLSPLPLKQQMPLAK